MVDNLALVLKTKLMTAWPGDMQTWKSSKCAGTFFKNAGSLMLSGFLD